MAKITKIESEFTQLQLNINNDTRKRLAFYQTIEVNSNEIKIIKSEL